MKSAQRKLGLVKPVDEKRQPSAEVLRKWAAIGSLIENSRQSLPVGWEPVARIIKAAQDKFNEDAENLRRLLKRSQRQLRPLDDPLKADFGTHRWLKGKREEAYSDWLAWIIERLGTSERIWKVFGVTADKPRSSQVQVKREPGTPAGHEGHTGRMDIVVVCDGVWSLLIEVKLKDADSGDTNKHEGYAKEWRNKPKVLIALSGKKPEYKGYKLRRWSAVCVELRQMIPKLKKEGMGIVERAMILAFVAAVEQNLLQFRGGLKEGIDRTHPVNPDLRGHLQAILGREHAKQIQP